MNKEQKLTLVVVGGGAAGFFAAIAAADAAPQAEIVLFEAGSNVLTKVAISGGGRCNVTHNCSEVNELLKGYPRGTKELIGPFNRFQATDTVEWFRKRGVRLKAEADGRMFPVSDDSATIVGCLEKEAAKAGVQVHTKIKVATVSHQEGKFSIRLKGDCSELIKADRLLLASGSASRGYKIAQSLGHQIIDPVPSLFTFEIKDKRIAELSGVSSPAQLSLLCPNGEKFNESGPLLITHWGLSGPAVLKLSAWAARPLHQCNYNATLSINWIGQNEEQAYSELLQEKEKTPKRLLTNSALYSLPKRLWEKLVEHTEIEKSLKWTDVSNQKLRQLAKELTSGMFNIQGKGTFKEEFVTCGGVSLKGVDFRSMQSKLSPGLFFAGEILDIDAITGGYNFQAAWTTGWIAGQSMAAATNNLN